MFSTTRLCAYIPSAKIMRVLCLTETRRNKNKNKTWNSAKRPNKLRKRKKKNATTKNSWHKHKSVFATLALSNSNLGMPNLEQQWPFINDLSIPLEIKGTCPFHNVSRYCLCGDGLILDCCFKTAQWESTEEHERNIERLATQRDNNIQHIPLDEFRKSLPDSSHSAYFGHCWVVARISPKRKKREDTKRHLSRFCVCRICSL